MNPPRSCPRCGQKLARREATCTRCEPRTEAALPIAPPPRVELPDDESPTGTFDRAELLRAIDADHRRELAITAPGRRRARAPAPEPEPPTDSGLEEAPDRPAPPRDVRSKEDVGPEGALQIALRMEQAGQLTEAATYLERAITRSPGAAPLYHRLACILMRDRQGRERAEKLVRHALKLSPGHPVFTRTLATLTQGRRQR